MSRVLPRFDFRVDIAAESVIGKVRDKNEDALLVAPEIALFGVADGMGGLSDGEHASRLALEEVRRCLSAKDVGRTLDALVETPTIERRRAVFAALRSACEAAHARLLDEQEKRGAPMGTTLDLCLFARDKAFIAHVGDGRALLVRPRATLQLTEDHLVRDPASVRLGREGRKLPRPLSSGVGLNVPLRVDVFVLDLHKNDTVVLASDGAYGPFADEAAITAACRGTPRVIADQFIKHSLAKGGRDNASLIVLRVEDRLVARTGERTQAGDDMSAIQHCPLFVALPPAGVVAALSAAIEVDVEAGQDVAAFEAGDLCAYVVLEGVLRLASGTTLGAPALVFAESLVGVEKPGQAAKVTERVRLLRIRRDDFREVAEHDPALGLLLFQRLAGHLARAVG